MTDKERRRYEKYAAIYKEWIKLYPFSTDNLDGEEWLPIPDYEELYHGSNFGRVKSFKNGEVKIKKPSLNFQGYLYVSLYKNGKEKIFRVNVLVGKLFIPNPENKPEVNHEDGVKFNNHVSNLVWATSSENKKHAYATGLAQSGEDHYKAKLTNEQVIYIRENPDGLTLKQLAEMFKVNNNIISKIQLGKTYKNVGGKIRTAQTPGDFHKIPDEKRAQILADYQKGVPGHGAPAVAKRFGVDAKTVWNIVNGK